MADEKKIKELGTVICKLTDKGAIYNDPIQGVSFTGGKLIQRVRRTPVIAQGIQRGQLVEVSEKEFTEWETERAAYVVDAKKVSLTKALEKEAKIVNKDKVVQDALKQVAEAKAEAEEAKAALEEVTKKNKKKDDKEDK
jgi:hypothetical protein